MVAGVGPCPNEAGIALRRSPVTDGIKNKVSMVSCSVSAEFLEMSLRGRAESHLVTELRSTQKLISIE